MTIEGLSKLIKESDANMIIPLENFSGYSIAIDGDGILYSKASTAYSKEVDRINVFAEEVDMSKVRDNTFNEIIAFLANFTKYGIEPIFVMDGATPILKRQQASIVRAEKRNNVKERMAKLMKSLDGFDVLSVTPEVLAEKRKLMKQMPPFFGEWKSSLQQFLHCLGFAFAQSREEADRLCSSLVKDGVCIAVFTTDYDVLVHGAHLMLKGFTFSDGKEAFQAISLEKFLAFYEISYHMLVDLAITMGCDYNIKNKKEKIKRIGPVNALKLVRQHFYIDYFPATKEWTALDHVNCRSIFYSVVWTDLIVKYNFTLKDGKVCLDIRMLPDVRSRLTSMGLSTDACDKVINTAYNVWNVFTGTKHVFSAYRPDNFHFVKGVESRHEVAIGIPAAVTEIDEADINPLLD